MENGEDPGMDRVRKKRPVWIAAALATLFAFAPPAGAVPLTEAMPGDVVTFGACEQDNDLGNGKEEIRWIVLDREDGRLLLVSRDLLHRMRYNRSQRGIEWEKSSLYGWLNGTFLNAAFSEGEQAMLTDRGAGRVSLLSAGEANRYFGSDLERRCEPTPYALSRGARKEYSGWWLRTDDYRSGRAPYVAGSGRVCRDGFGVTDGSCAVRPAVWVTVDDTAAREGILLAVGGSADAAFSEDRGGAYAGDAEVTWVTVKRTSGDKVEFSFRFSAHTSEERFTLFGRDAADGEVFRYEKTLLADTVVLRQEVGIAELLRCATVWFDHYTERVTGGLRYDIFYTITNLREITQGRP